MRIRRLGLALLGAAAMIAGVAPAGQATHATWQLRITVEGSGTVSVAGSVCPSNCLHNLSVHGAQLTATASSGWVFGSWSGSCTGTSPTCTVNKAGNMGKYPVTAAFTKKQAPPRLTVIKQVINDNGGTATAASFTMNVSGTSPSPASFPGAGPPGTTVTLGAGSYSVTESGPSGYAATYSADCSGTIAAGQTRTCTVTNNDQAPPPPVSDCTITGTTGNDTLVGTSGNDVICGLGGNDTIKGKGGNDTIRGGFGRDTIEGGDGDDTLYGGADIDILEGELGQDDLYGGDQADTLRGGIGRDYIEGNGGNDSIYGGLDGDRALGGPGNDTIRGGSGYIENLFGGPGNDTIYGEEGFDYIEGEAGDDRIYAGQGKDIVYGNDGDDVLSGESGSDWLKGGRGQDELYGGSGGDAFRAEDGERDVLRGGSGCDGGEWDVGLDDVRLAALPLQVC